VGEQIRRAAATIAIQPGPDRPRVLVVERSTASRFLPGYAVFPGGAVEEGDALLATSWFGSEREAPRVTAVRELAEETGIVLTGEGLRPTGSDGPLTAALASPPSVYQLAEIARWVAPQDVPVRFDATYFAAAAPPGLEPVPDGHEASNAWWASPSDLLDAWRAGDLKLYWPTYFTMLQLAPLERVDELLSLRFATREPADEDLERLPRSVFWQR
jgi:8-oxo-dGTP pyrophosphatase MutT (NUDIX family)